MRTTLKLTGFSVSLSSGSELAAIPAEKLDRVLPVIFPAFELMASRSLGCFNAMDYVGAVRDKSMQLWLAHDGPKIEAVLLTEIIQFPRRKVLQYIACVGRDYRKWVELRKRIDEWGRSEGCTLVRMVSPRKWLSANDDLKEWHVIAVKELT